MKLARCAKGQERRPLERGLVKKKEWHGDRHRQLYSSPHRIKIVKLFVFLAFFKNHRAWLTYSDSRRVHNGRQRFHFSLNEKIDTRRVNIGGIATPPALVRKQSSTPAPPPILSGRALADRAEESKAIPDRKSGSRGAKMAKPGEGWRRRQRGVVAPHISEQFAV